MAGPFKEMTGWAAVKAHPFFAKVDWAVIAAKSLTPPYVPQLKKIR